LEQIYADTEEQGAAQVLKADMQKEREELERKAVISLGMADAPGDDERASTRINDHEEVQVLLIRKGNGGLPLRERVAALFADAPIVIPPAGASARERVVAVRALLRCMINVPEYLAPRYEDFETEPLLGGIMWTGQEHIRPIRAAYVDESGLLLSQAGTVLRSEWCYHEKLGYCVN